MCKIKLDVLLNHLKGLNKPVEERSNESSIQYEETEQPFNAPFTLDNILKAIAKLKNNKACGLDIILNEYLKISVDVLAPLLVKLFNIILDTGNVPIDWTVGIIQPIYKNKGSDEDPNNFRGITLLSCLGKLFTALLNERLYTFLVVNGYLGSEQNAFRPAYSTMDSIFLLKMIIDFYAFKKKRLYCAFIDFEKAFDTINRRSLWSKIIANGINGKILRVIMNLYANAKSCVRKEGKLSEMFSSSVGVRQGENLSPLLFAIYVNDLKTSMSSCYDGLPTMKKCFLTQMGENSEWEDLFVLLYADDTVILAESEDQLQKAITGMYNYCKKWQLRVNIKKSKVMVFSRGVIRKKPKIMYNNNLLDVCNEFVYLGIKLNCNGSLKKGLEYLSHQANNAMFSLLSKVRKLSLTIDTAMHLFECTVLPIILYGCEIWGHEDIKAANTLYLRFYKILLGLKKSSNTCLILGELGKLPLRSIINKRMIYFWAKLVLDDQHKLSGNILKWITTLKTNSGWCPSWLNFIHNTLDMAGLSQMWCTPNIFSANYIKKYFNLRSTDIAK